jgi:hypothetical protein
MNRVKTFDSTGVAPNGKLFAGDLNAIQDAAAAAADFAQTVDLATLRVGASDVQLSRFGANEGQFSGHLRTLGILRSLGGWVSGAFTTTQRDAIVAGSRPFGLVILNTTTNRLEYNAGTDAVPSWQGVGRGIINGDIAAAAAISGTKMDLSGSVHMSGTAAARTNAVAIANPGALYVTTDEFGGTVYRSNGATWDRIAPGQKPMYASIGINHGFPGGPDLNFRICNNGTLATDSHNSASSWLTSTSGWVFRFPVAGKYKITIGAEAPNNVGGTIGMYLLNTVTSAYVFGLRFTIGAGSDPPANIPYGGTSVGPRLVDVASASDDYRMGGFFNGGAVITSWLMAEQVVDY